MSQAGQPGCTSVVTTAKGREVGDGEGRRINSRNPRDASLRVNGIPRILRLRLPVVLHPHRLEAVAPADRSDLQVQRCVPRVTAIIQQLLGSLVPSANRGDLIGLRMRLTKVDTQPALPVKNLLHVSPPFLGLGRRTSQVPRSQVGDGRQTAGTGDGRRLKADALGLLVVVVSTASVSQQPPRAAINQPPFPRRSPALPNAYAPSPDATYTSR